MNGLESANSTLGAKIGSTGAEIIQVRNNRTDATGITQFQVITGPSQGPVSPFSVGTPTLTLFAISALGEAALVNQKGFLYFDNPSLPYRMSTALDGVEGGANSGSNYYLSRYSDAGNFLGMPLYVRRSDGRVGINNVNPGRQLDIGGQFKLADSEGAQPACDATTQFTFWVTAGGVGVKDKVEVCAKDAGNTFVWRVVY